MAAFVLVNGKVTLRARIPRQKADRVSLLSSLDARHVGPPRKETQRRWRKLISLSWCCLVHVG